jgi:hypothetical protein
VHTSRLGGAENRSQIVRIFNAVKKEQKWRLVEGSCSLKNLLRSTVGFSGDEGNDTLVPPAGNQPFEGSGRLDMDGNSPGASQSNELGKLFVNPLNKKSPERTGVGTEGLPHCAESIEELGLFIASTGWCHQGGPRG